MSGWDAVQRVTLAEPWQDFWVDVYLDPPMGVYIDMRAAASEVLSVPSSENIDALIGTMPPLIAAHNITGRDGEPIVWGVRTMGGKLVVAIKDALTQVQDGGAPAGPLPPPMNRETSRASGSAVKRSRSTTRSGA
jgi:hypothetical protein